MRTYASCRLATLLLQPDKVGWLAEGSFLHAFLGGSVLTHLYQLRFGGVGVLQDGGGARHDAA